MTTGVKLARQYGIKVDHALYRKSGDWYHSLKRFPSALFDEQGYVLFKTADEYRNSPFLQIRKDVHVPSGIQAIPEYVRFSGIRTSRIHALNRVFLEGAPREVRQNRYERDRQARMACLSVHGFRCCVCSMSFEERYGDLGRDYIHVHHLEQLASSRRERSVNPERDLVPICPNCHAMIHRRKQPITVDALRSMLNRSTRQSL